ncbi:MAG TPA: methyltransferase domain-containing protein [Chloroflexota bacterium]|nr:methyltransferase domain-containing protein [Chloroflexota bacterium]
MRRAREAPVDDWREFEVEVVEGLEGFVEAEIRERFDGAARLAGRPRPGRLDLAYRGGLTRLNALQTATAVYAVLTFAVPRPKALLGQQHFDQIVKAIAEVLALYPPRTFTTLRVSGAGAGSPVFTRLKTELADRFRLQVVETPAELQIAVRPAVAPEPGWQVLIRTSPRPLSARAWRVCDLPGALNATVANAMDRLARPRPSARFLNLACGSGTLLIERLALGPARLAVGVDNDPAALACAAQNLAASAGARQVQFFRADATRLPFPSNTFDTIVVDLPYGMLHGSRRENETFYPALLAEAARVTAPGALFAGITTSKRVFDAAVAEFLSDWTPRQSYPLKVPFRNGYIYPAIFVLERVAKTGHAGRA